MPRIKFVPVGLICAAAVSAFALPVLSQDMPQEEARPAPVPPPGPEWETIAFEAKSWGAPIARWEFSANSGGVWIAIKDIEGKPVGNFTRSYHLLGKDQQRYRDLEALIRQLPFPAPDPGLCRNKMNDMAYGTLRLTKGAMTTEIAWNSGCQDEGYRRFMTTLREADELVASWGKGVPASRTETITSE